jgi:hypothetical protein
VVLSSKPVLLILCGILSFSASNIPLFVIYAAGWF